MSYFLIAVSNRYNLEACIRHALAGFTSSASGLWTYLDIARGDYVSFLYGARIFNLYQVREKVAIKNAETVPPWPPLVLQPSGRTYYFPFRLQLRPVRTLEEPLVRLEFAYVAENLLLRGGYRKTHFQADQTTLQAVSQMGVVAGGASNVSASTRIRPSFRILFPGGEPEVRPRCSPFKNYSFRLWYGSA